MDKGTATLRFPQAVLRNETTVIEEIGLERDLGRTTRQALFWGAAAAALFGVTLGAYDQSWIQIMSSAVKLGIAHTLASAWTAIRSDSRTSTWWTRPTLPAAPTVPEPQPWSVSGPALSARRADRARTAAE